MNPSPHKWLIFIATGIMIMLVNVDGSIVNLALATIAKSFHISLNATQWVSASYLLTTTVSFALFGRLADSLGRKKIFLWGVVFFTLSSLLAGLAPNYPLLLCARLVQGLGFAATLSICFVIATQNFPQHQWGMIMGIFITITGLSQAMGPTLGGVIIHYLSWRWIFLINVPLGLLSFGMSLRFIGRDTPKPLSINWLNTGVFMISLGLLLIVINQLAVLPAVWIVIGLAMSVAGLALFVRSSLRSVNPLIDTSLLTHRRYLLVVLCRFLFMTFCFGVYFITPLYLQNILGYSPRSAGFMLLAMTLIIAIISPITGKIIDQIGFAKPILLSLLLMLLASVMMLFFQVSVNLWLLFASFMVMGLSVGVQLPASVNAVTRIVRAEKAGQAMGTFFTAAMAGGTIGIAMAGNLLQWMSHHYLFVAITKLNATMNTATLQIMRTVGNGAASANLLTNPQYRQLAKQAFLSGFHSFMLLSIILAVIGSLFARQLLRHHEH